jgi:hypothetical protein
VTCDCGSNAKAVRNGKVETSWLDLLDGKAVRMAAPAARMLCRCGRSWTAPPPENPAGAKLTGRLVDAVFADSLSSPLAAVAEKFGLKEWVVRDVFHEGALRLAQRVEPVGAVVLRRQEAGARLLVLACDGDEQRVVDAFDGFDDARFSEFVRASSGSRVHADWRCAPFILSQGLRAASVTVHRASVKAWLWSCMPECVESLWNSMAKAAKPTLRGVGDALALPRLSVTLKQAASLKDACGKEELIRLFVRLRDDLMAVFDANGAAAAEADYDRWKAKLGDLFTGVFSQVTKGLERMRICVFNAGYAAVPNLVWNAIEALRIDLGPKEPVVKAVVRWMALCREAGPGMGAGYQYVR